MRKYPNYKVDGRYFDNGFDTVYQYAVQHCLNEKRDMEIWETMDAYTPSHLLVKIDYAYWNMRATS